MGYAVGLVPREVWQMTPAELVDVIDARLDDAAAQREFTAGMTAAMLRAWVKSAPRAHELLSDGDRQRLQRRLARALEHDKRTREDD